MSQRFTPDDVSSHNSADDLWMVLHGKVYDVTKFLKEHPGGEEVLINLAGQDGTQCFDDIGHSQEAKQLKDTFEIGVLEGSLKSNNAGGSSGEGATIDDDDWEYEPPKRESSPYLPLFIALGVLVYATLFYYIYY
ncbi:hypothetical protein QAD02_022129 [Eretmocerus hayati]|uniref:Uncharacterized protein n=1 Tax=Eretmocerus hayati TaxID=131215 RepID=A0ACC2PRU3_9HYME|nr:hypothetical protein QAD02_022129 [Eretmocerus hayati]